MPARVPDDEREQIIAEFVTGKSCNAIAKQFGRSPDTISRIAKSVGHKFGYPHAKKAQATKRLYDREGRIDLIELGLEQQRKVLKTSDTPHKMQAWWLGMAVAMDKRRQEDESDSKRYGTIRQYLELELNRPGPHEPETDQQHNAGD